MESAGGGLWSPAGAADRGTEHLRHLRAGAKGGPLGSLPNPAAVAGTDQIPEIENFVVLMLENHSFDNLLGMMGRGDCFPKDADGLPTITLPDGHGNLVRAFHMPRECQTDGVGNNWNLAHHSLSGRGNTGFVEGSTGESVGYFLQEDLPFTWDLAATFPLADRWFSSVLGQTDPNRRYLFAGTSRGQIADVFTDDLPPNGTIFDMFNRYDITWKDYFSNLPSIGVWLPLLGEPSITANLKNIDSFFTDAAAGQLPQFSLVEPDYNKSSEENPQDIQFGDQLLGDVVNAVMHGPQWSKTMLIWTYDEWGGWYDHVAPPAAIPPDDVPPVLSPNSAPGAFDRYGFRVPGGVVSPFAKQDYVSHRVFDHTSVLKTVELKWNLPSMTLRDAHALDLYDMVDLKSPPAFLTPPALAAPANPALSEVCLTTGPGHIPPRAAVQKDAVPNTPVIKPGSLPVGAVGVPYHFPLRASSVEKRARWLVLSDDLPPGLVLDPDTGVITGVPTAKGSTGFAVGVSQGRGPIGSRHYDLVVN
jgi:phospholipase C